MTKLKKIKEDILSEKDCAVKSVWSEIVKEIPERIYDIIINILIIWQSGEKFYPSQQRTQVNINFYYWTWEMKINGKKCDSRSYLKQFLCII